MYLTDLRLIDNWKTAAMAPCVQEPTSGSRHDDPVERVDGAGVAGQVLLRNQRPAMTGILVKTCRPVATKASVRDRENGFRVASCRVRAQFRRWAQQRIGYGRKKGPVVEQSNRASGWQVRCPTASDDQAPNSRRASTKSLRSDRKNNPISRPRLGGSSPDVSA